MVEKSLNQRYLKNNLSLNDILDEIYFQDFSILYDHNHRAGIFIDYIINISTDTKEVYYSFRGRIVLSYNLEHKKITFFNDEYSMCMFQEDDYKIMSLFLNNCLKDIQGLGVDLESYEVN